MLESSCARLFLELFRRCYETLSAFCGRTYKGTRGVYSPTVSDWQKQGAKRMWKVVSVSTCVVMLLIISAGALFQEGRLTQVDGQPTSNRMDFSVQNNLQEFGVRVVESNDLSFDALLREYVGQSNYDKVLPLISAAKPSAIFIKNESEKEIVGVALRWLFVGNNGTITEAKQIESSPGALLGMKPRDPFMVGKTSLINGNSVRYFTHYHGLATPVINFFKSNSFKRFKYSLDSQHLESLISYAEYEKNTALKDVKAISVIVDAIIFKDGTFVGENRAHLIELTKGTIQARRDFLKEVREAKRLNKSDAQALDDFVSNAARRESTTKTGIQKLSEGDEAFNQSYESHVNEYAREIATKRLRATDAAIVKDLLATNDLDFIELREVGGLK